MTNTESTVQKTDLSLESFISPAVKTPDYHQTRITFYIHNEEKHRSACKDFETPCGMNLPERNMWESYLRI